MKKSALSGKSYAGNPNMRFDAGVAASENLKRGSLLCMKMRVGVSAVVLSAAVAVNAATTWQVSMDQPDAQGLTGVASLSNALERVTSGDTIVIGPGTYDLSKMPTIECGSYALCSIVAFSVNNGVLSSRQAAVHLRGQNIKPWYEKTPEEETVLLGTGAATIFYGSANPGRESSAAHITFENGKWAKDGARTQYGGGAISFAATQQCDLKALHGAASNCVFRSCSSDTFGGGTYRCDVTDCLYTNCSAKTGGGGAYGDMKNNNVNVNHTNVFVRCVFADCSSANGGAIYAHELTSLTGCTFIDCQATAAGAGVYVANPLEYVGDCVFTNCSAGTDGCGLRVVGNLGLLTNCTFAACRSTGTGNGGAINTRNDAKDDKIEKVIGCTFSDCLAGWAGGALFVDHLGEIVNCTFAGNGATSSGGAIFSANFIDRVANSTFADNVSTTSGGGAFKCNGSCASIERCVFVQNSCGSNGGGAEVLGALPIVSNCVFVGNLATNGTGGALSTDQHLGAVTDCTFAENAAKSAAGVYTSVAVGAFTNCMFHANTNPPTAFGAHANLAHDMIRCRFSGYGDVGAKNYDGCVFSNCVYQYTERDYGSDHHGLLTYSQALGDGTIRNCLVHDCTVSRILATEGVRTDVANCTFVNNYVDDDPPEGKDTHAIMFFAFRGGWPTVSSTNVMVNCIFADNRVRGKKDGKACDLYCSGSTSPVGHTIVSNCLYKNANSVVWGNGTHEESNLNQSDPMFVAGNAKYPDAPYYMIRHSSSACGHGVWESWMAGATDLSGTAYPGNGHVDLGCYQCNLPFSGLLLIFK